MCELFQELYPRILFINDSNLEIDTTNYNIVCDNSDYDIVVRVTQEKQENFIKFYINIEDKEDDITYIPIIEKKLLTIVLDILLHKEISPIPFDDFIYPFQQPIRIMNQNHKKSINDLEFLWIHIEDTNIIEAQDRFNKICDDIDKYDKNIEIYFSYIPSNKNNIYYLANFTESIDYDSLEKDQISAAKKLFLLKD